MRNQDLQPSPAVALDNALRIHRDSHRAVARFLNRGLKDHQLDGPDAVVTKAAALFDDPATSPPGQLRKVFIDYWRNLSYYTSRHYDPGPRVSLSKAFTQQLSQFDPEALILPLHACLHYPRSARRLLDYRTHSLVHRSEYTLISGRIERLSHASHGTNPCGHELLDLYAEIGTHLARWAAVDPHFQMLDIALAAHSPVADTFADLTSSVDHVLDALRSA